MATRDNAGKVEWHLLPWDALEQVVRVMMMGKVKYGEYNWTGGLPASSYFDSEMRHRIAEWRGQDNDLESKLAHDAHVAANALMKLATTLRHGDAFDDRPEE